MVFQRSECSSYRCDGSFRKLCSATCICAFTTLPMVAALVPALCTLSATCLRFPRRCCFCVRSAGCSRRVRVQNPEKKWGVLGACHALNALNARIFFSRCSTGPFAVPTLLTRRRGTVLGVVYSQTLPATLANNLLLFSGLGLMGGHVRDYPPRSK
jgi:hypothetical protein